MQNQLDTVETPAATGDAAVAWSACLTSIQTQVPNQSFKTWFEPIKATKLEDGELTVQVPSQFFYEWLEEHYNSLIKATISTYLGGDARLTYVVVPPDDSELPAESHTVNATRADGTTIVPLAHSPSSFPPQENEVVLPPIKTFLNPRYTFTNFIKGDSNQLARAAASAVSNNPGGTSFNPLVLYGGTGLGKTHLIQAIGNYAFVSGKARRVCFVSCE